MDSADVDVGIAVLGTSCMKYVCFNELTLNPYCDDSQDAESRVRQYVDLIRALHLHYGVKLVRYHENMVNMALTENMSMQQYCEKYRHSVLSSILLSTFTMPQIDENDEDVLGRYCDTQVTVEKEGRSVAAHGFNAAYCQGTFCIGFESEEFWSKCLYSITVISGRSTKSIEWASLSNKVHLSDAGFEIWSRGLSPVELSRSLRCVEDKELSLRDDHGKDVLMKHAEKLLNCEYVDGVVNSLPFNPRYGRYIYKIYDNGQIYVVLHWTDKGYGLVLQTTGRNIRETEKIADIIEQRYGRK